MQYYTIQQVCMPLTTAVIYKVIYKHVGDRATQVARLGH